MTRTGPYDSTVCPGNIPPSLSTRRPFMRIGSFARRLEDYAVFQQQGMLESAQHLENLMSELEKERSLVDEQQTQLLQLVLDLE